jgi:hypothetical protein
VILLPGLGPLELPRGETSQVKVGPATGILTVPGELNHVLYLLSGDQFLTYRAEPPDAGPRPGASRVSPRQLSTADRMARELTDDDFIGHGPRPPAEPLVAGVERRTKRLCVLWPYSPGRAAGVPLRGTRAKHMPAGAVFTGFEPSIKTARY